MTLVTIRLEQAGDPTPPPAPWSLHLERPLVDAGLEAVDPGADGSFRAWREERMEHARRTVDTLDAAAAAAGGKLKKRLIYWQVPRKNELPRGHAGHFDQPAGLFGGPDDMEVIQAIATLANTGAAVAFMKLAKDVILEWMKRPHRKLTIKHGRVTIGGARSAAEIEKIMEMLERRHAEAAAEPAKQSSKRGRTSAVAAVGQSKTTRKEGRLSDKNKKRRPA